MVRRRGTPSYGEIVVCRVTKVNPNSCECHLEEYGMEKVIAMLKSPAQVEAILGVSLSELDAGWRAYLHRTYQ